MAGRVLQLVPKRVYDFGGLATGGAQGMAISERIDVSRHIDCIVALRLHALAMAAGNTIKFDVFGDGYTEEDSSLLFQTGTVLFSTTTLTSSASAPQLFTYGGTIRGQYAKLVVNASKTVAGSISATVSIDLILRTPNRG